MALTNDLKLLTVYCKQFTTSDSVSQLKMKIL